MYLIIDEVQIKNPCFQGIDIPSRPRFGAGGLHPCRARFLPHRCFKFNNIKQEHKVITM